MILTSVRDSVSFGVFLPTAQGAAAHPPPLNASCAYFKAFSFVCFVFLVRMEASGAVTAFKLYVSNFLNLILSSAWPKVALSKCYKLIVK